MPYLKQTNLRAGFLHNYIVLFSRSETCSYLWSLPLPLYLTSPHPTANMVLGTQRARKFLFTNPIKKINEIEWLENLIRCIFVGDNPSAGHLMNLATPNINLPQPSTLWSTCNCRDTNHNLCLLYLRGYRGGK